MNKFDRKILIMVTGLILGCIIFNIINAINIPIVTRVYEFICKIILPLIAVIMFPFAFKKEIK